MSIRQPGGQAVFSPVVPGGLDGEPFPAFPPPSCLAVVAGQSAPSPAT